MRSKKPILLIEDDSIDAMTVERALKDVRVTNRLDVIGDGEKALEYLRTNQKTKPCIILLDLNMPKMNGIEFLKTARQKGLLNGTPVIVLTSSTNEKFKSESFHLKVAGYMIKPISYEQFSETIRIIDLYWSMSELPEE